MQEVPQQCKSLEVVFEFDENVRLGVGVIEQRSFPAFALRPFEDVPLHFSRDGVCKMRASRCHLGRSQKLEKEQKYLLRDVLFGQALLLPGYEANGTMQHRKKYENQKALGESGVRFAKREDFAEEVVVGCVGRRSSEMGQQVSDRRMLPQCRVGRKQTIHGTRIQTSKSRKQLCFDATQRAATLNFKGHGRTPLTPRDKLGANRKAGTRSRDLPAKLNQQRLRGVTDVFSPLISKKRRRMR